MNSTEAGLEFPSGAARRHSAAKRDRDFLLLVIAIIWAAIIGGFAPEIVRRNHGTASYPAVVYFHGAAFGGWLALFTTQVLLIRAHQARLHASLGILGAILAGSMLALGPWTALVMHRPHLGTPDANRPSSARSCSTSSSSAVWSWWD